MIRPLNCGIKFKSEQNTANHSQKGSDTVARFKIVHKLKIYGMALCGFIDSKFTKMNWATVSGRLWDEY